MNATTCPTCAGRGYLGADTAAFVKRTAEIIAAARAYVDLAESDCATKMDLANALRRVTNAVHQEIGR